MYTRARRKVTRIEQTALIFLTITIASLSFPIGFVADSQAIGDGDYTPIKWALIVLGGFEYYKHPPGYNAIQKSEHWIQSRGVPYDVIEDDYIEAPTDLSKPGKHPLQYANGTIRYQVLVIVMNHHMDSSAANINCIYWAVGNGTNAVCLGTAAKYVPELLNIFPNDVSYIEDYGIHQLNCTIHRTFSDGIIEYKQDSIQTIDHPYFLHANVSNTKGKTVWYTMHSNTGRNWIGMMNTTYGSGRVFWSTVVPSCYEFFHHNQFSKYWETKNLKFVAHALNFIFNQVERVDVRLQGYKSWAGAIVHRLDQDDPYGIAALNETALKAGWVVDQVICSLGYMTGGGSLQDGLPPGYTGVPLSKTTKWGEFNHLVATTSPFLLTSRRFIVYNSTNGGDYDRIKIDWNNDQNFADDTEYKIWENQTHTSVVGTYYWSYIDNWTDPAIVRLGWWSLLGDRISDFAQWKTWGQQGYVAYGLHSYQHQACGTGALLTASAGTHHFWNGTNFVLDQTLIEQKYTEAINELGKCLGSTGYGFEAEEVLVSHAGNEYQPEVEAALFNLDCVYLKYGDNAKNEPGWFLYSDKKPSMTCGGGEEPASEGWRVDAWIDAVNTLFPIFGIYEHGGGTFNLSYTFPPYSDMFCFVHLDDSYEFWVNARYMKRNTVNAYYGNNKIVLEYHANSTLEDYVWKFPLELDGKYFNGFSDNRSIGKIKHIDGRYVYIEFSEGGNERLEATYGTYPHICQTSSYIQNMVQKYAPKNLTLQLWNTLGTINIEVRCTKLPQPTSVKIDGTSINFNYNSATNICSFNVTLNDLKVVEIIWEHAPPNPPILASPSAAARFDPSKSVAFTWTFSDPDIGDSQSAFEFQLDDNSEFTSPIIDTGKITSSSSWTAQTLPNTVSLYYWRVNTWDNRDSEGWWSEGQKIIVDRLRIASKGATDGRTDVGASTSVYFIVAREYDNAVFDGTKGKVYINESEAAWDETNKYWKIDVKQDSVGEWNYRVSGIADEEHSISSINDLFGTQPVIWDRLEVTMTADVAIVSVGTQVDFRLKAAYTYDNKHVTSWSVKISRDGEHFATNNFTDTCSVASMHSYMVESVTEATYGLAHFTSNSLTVTWKEVPKTFVQRVIDYMAANVLIILLIVNSVVVVFLFARVRKKKIR